MVEVELKVANFSEFLDSGSTRTIVFDVDTSSLDEGYRNAIPKILKALGIIDKIFLMQDHPQSVEIKEKLLRAAENGSEDAAISLEVFGIFNSPLGVSRTNKPVALFQGISPRPPGGTVYTEGITAEEIEAFLQKHPESRESFDKINTAIERDGNGGLMAVPYEEKYREQLAETSALLKSAAVSQEIVELHQRAHVMRVCLVGLDFRKGPYQASVDNRLPCLFLRMHSLFNKQS